MGRVPDCESEARSGKARKLTSSLLGPLSDRGCWEEHRAASGELPGVPTPLPHQPTNSPEHQGPAASLGEEVPAGLSPGGGGRDCSPTQLPLFVVIQPGA